MIYLFESKLPETKSIYFALKYIYGIGKNRSFLICKKLGFLPNVKVKNLSSSQINQISKFIESSNFILANDLRRLNLLNKQKLLAIKSYRGLRRKKGFPVRGQRTHTNAKTAKRIR
uniref:Ribosomal protein S13 n=1 Tax=Navicula veneta TaxID=138539 RepID=A0A8F1B867_9STRA|nr:ribosomal protein S13 [Navicula veneta]QWM93660.1 ribosomal protein S13 [Navicula veneta]